MKNIRAFFFCICCLPFAQIVYACGNEYFQPTQIPVKNDSLLLSHLLNPPSEFSHPYWWNGFGPNIKSTRDSLYTVMANKTGLYPESIDKKYATIIQKLLTANEFKLLSDFAWYELRVGDKKRSLLLLEELYKRYPNEYNVVANLGTAYEVNGNDIKALELLKKAVEINSRSHYNSEWIHIKILEQKIATPPDFTKVMNLEIKDFTAWLNDQKYQFQQAPDSLKKQLAYQLHERISFINPPDPVIAQLVLDFADIVAKHDGHAAALPFYEFASVYGKENMNAIVTKRKEIIAQTKKDIETTFRRAAIIWAVPLLAFVLIFFAWLRSRRNQRKEQNLI
jgi:tetratricopeptide (TPR) repeat protein